jgi:hypothetical protein
MHIVSSKAGFLSKLKGLTLHLIFTLMLQAATYHDCIIHCGAALQFGETALCAQFAHP